MPEKIIKGSLALFAFSFGSLGVLAQISGPEFGFTQEFISACHNSNVTFDSADKVFTDLSWDVADKDITEIMKPDDVLDRVYKHKAWSVELSDGSQWYASVANGKFNKNKYTYCTMMIVVDELGGWRADLEKAPGLKQFDDITTAEGGSSEFRRAYHVGDKGASIIVREIKGEDILAISMGKFIPIVKTSKKKG